MADNEQPQSVTQGVTKVAGAGIAAMAGSPLALALLVVNLGFLTFAGFVLTHVASNARERNHSQNELITNLVKDIRDCRQPASPQRAPSQTPDNGVRDDTSEKG